MKKIILLAVLALAVPLQGCDSVFEGVEPRTSITSELALTGIEGYEALLVSVYDRLQRYQRYGQYFMLYPDALADNIQHTTPHSNRYPSVVNNVSGTHMNEWTAPYFAINEANYIIHWIERLDPNEVPRPNAEQLIQEIRGQAYFLRALSYFDLLRTKAYEPGMEVGGWNHGVILRTEPVDRIEQANYRARERANEVYQVIESDLQEAISHLSETSDGTDNQFATLPAAQALLARVYLYQRKWEQAAQAATQALNGTTKTLVQDTGSNEYHASWQATFHPEAIFELRMTPAQDGDATSVNQSIHALTWGEEGNQVFSFEAIPTQELLDAHEEDDARFDLYAEGVKGANTVIYIQKWPANVGNQTTNIPLIRLPELYLIRAEARAETGNNAGARADLNTLRAARGLGPVDAGLAGAAVVEQVYRERRVEFAFEGHRFFDLKRRGMDIPKPQTAAGEISYQDFRLLAPLPTSEVVANPLLIQNPGY